MEGEDTEIEIRRAERGDEFAIQAFIAETYGPTAPYKDTARWRWQYVDNPFRVKGDVGPTVWIATSGGRVIGQIAVQDGAAWVDGARIDAGWIVDVMVHPTFRGRGLGHRIHDRILEDRSALVTLTMAAATRRIAERAGCMSLGPTWQFICPKRLSGRTVRRFLRHKAERKPKLLRPIGLFNATRVGPALLAGTGRAIAAFAGRSSSTSTGYDIEEVARFPEEVDDLWRRAKGAFPAVFERSVGFLNWRFCDCPGLTYRRFLLRRNGVIRGYLVTRVGEPTELPLGVVADMLAEPDDPMALDSLLTLAQEVLGPNSDYLEAAASNPAYCAALRRAGFLAVRTMRPTIVCTDPALRVRLAARVDNWHFTIADHDWDQVHPV